MDITNLNLLLTVTPGMSGYAMSYQISGLLADKMFPQIDNLDGKDAFSLLIVNPEDTMRSIEDRVGRRSEPNEIEYAGTKLTDSCEAHFLTGFVSKNDIVNADQGRYEGLVNREQGMIWNTILLNRERRCIKLAQDPANYAYKKTLTATESLKAANADIIGLLKDYLDQCLMRPNQLRMGGHVWSVLQSHPSIVSAVYPNGNGKGAVKAEDLASVLRVGEILVGEAKFNTAAKGQAGVFASVWGNTISAAYVDKNATTTEAAITHGFTAVNGGRVVNLLEAPKKGGRGGIEVMVGNHMKEVVTTTHCGFLLSDVLKTA